MANYMNPLLTEMIHMPYLCRGGTFHFIDTVLSAKKINSGMAEAW